MNKKWWCTGLLALVVVLGTACGDKPQVGPTNSPKEGQSETVTVPEKEKEKEKEVPATDASGENGSVNTDKVDKGNVKKDEVEASAKKESISVYFTDTQEMELKESKQEITFEDDIQKYKAAFKALQTSNNDELIPLWGKVELKSLDIKEGAITMDIHLPDEARLGAGGEMFALESLQKTLFQFDEVKSIELLVDGQQVESLMGHADLEHPMTKK
ncbi:GerMN domain-containing protein [Paenibacillus glacialis]|uniref:GerMN domain-containing protein n=1 Tax=Paenibacillus glacialis TaxID=494026 RepID=A0A162MGQ2_9BACL|nr:GerMN domain-containing protein [Paenibacillus glacialis]OAB44353.1 hypothetical protein PGLA_06745 [Paenibacillus glacialis]